MRREDTIILGGGPAGSAAAITLARAGHAPLMLERQRSTGDALCGGFLSWHSLAVLDQLGVHKLRGATVDHVRVFSRLASARSPLPHPALGVSRRQLDACLLARSETLGARVERGVTARAIEDGGIRCEAEIFRPARLLLATGKHDVRGAARPKPDADPCLGLRVRLGPGLGLTKLVEGAIELHLFDRGYAGAVLQEDGSVNLCLAVRKSRLAEEGGPRALLAAIGRELPSLGDRVAWLEDAADIDAIASVPYGWRASHTDGDLYRLGDQAGVIPSLAGEGIAIALASGALAGAAVMRGRSAQAFQRHLARRTLRPILVARAILALAERPASAAALVQLMGFAPGLATLLARVTRLGKHPLVYDQPRFRGT